VDRIRRRQPARLVERVDVSDDGIRVRLRTEGLRDVVRELQGDPTLDQAA